MDSIQSLITDPEHLAILLQAWYQYHFRAVPVHVIDIEVKAETVPELAKAANKVIPELIPAIISALHLMNANLNGHTQAAAKKQKQFNLQLEEVT